MSSTMNEKVYYVTRVKLAFAFAQWIDEMRQEGYSDQAQIAISSMLEQTDPVTPLALQKADILINYLKKQTDPKEEDY